MLSFFGFGGSSQWLVVEVRGRSLTYASSSWLLPRAVRGPQNLERLASAEAGAMTTIIGNWNIANLPSSMTYL